MADNGEIPKKGGIPSSYVSALVILVAVILYFLLGTLFGGSSEPDAEAVEERPPFTVLIRDIEGQAQAETINLSGRTEAAKRIIVRTETAGQVVELAAEEGTDVKRGDTLCRLDTDSRREVAAEAEAAVRQATTDYNAAKKLFDEGFGSEAALNQAQAGLDAAQARHARARDDLRNIDVKAPFDGLVAETLVDPGDVLSVGGGCAVLADLSGIIVAGGVPARDAARLSPGDKAEVHLLDGTTFSAEVRFVSDVADPSTRAFRIELKAIDAPKLPEGVEARAVITAGSRPAALVPRNTLVYSDDGVLGVRTIEPTGETLGELPGATVHFRPVTLLSENGHGAYVGGLGDEAMLIVRGQEYVSDGITVTYREEDAP